MSSVEKGADPGWRACDNCRARKIKCDKGSPCSNCRSSNTTCRTTPVRQVEHRNRVLISAQYEMKIDRIESRLASLETTLKSIAEALPPRLDICRSSPRDSTPQKQRTAESSEDDKPTGSFEGESSFRAHSVYATEFITKVIGDSPQAKQNAEMADAIASLQSILSRQSIGPSNDGTLINDNSKRTPLFTKSLPLPQLEVVLEVLKMAKHEFTMTSYLIGQFLSIDALTDLVKSVFFSLDEYSPQTGILAYGGLYFLLMEYLTCNGGRYSGNPYDQSLEVCKKNLEACISNISLLQPATTNNVSALLLGACYNIEMAKPSLSWALVATAADLAQRLGYHRPALLEGETPEAKQSKNYVFYFIYYLDKSLSLRMGRASTIQDYDIATPFPSLSPDLDFNKLGPTQMLIFLAKLASIQGRIYQHLYSSSALSKSTEARVEKALGLAAEMTDLMDTHSTRFGTIDIQSQAAKPLLQIMTLSDRVTFLSNLTLIYRAIPPSHPAPASGFNTTCVDYARQALATHYESYTQLKTISIELWTCHLHWAIFHAPFTPFLVVFCHAIATCNTSDLNLLSDFIATIRPSIQESEAADRLFRLSTVFYKVARLYVDAKLAPTPPTTNANPQAMNVVQSSLPSAEAQASNTSQLSTTQLDAYLNALGFAPQGLTGSFASGMPPPQQGRMAEGQGGDWTMGPAASLEDWYAGNQYVMGLLEQDLSHLQGSWS